MYHMTHLLQCHYSIRHNVLTPHGSCHHHHHHSSIYRGIPNRTVLQPCFKSIRVCNRNPKSCMRMNEWLTDCQAEAGMARWLASLAVNEWSRNASQGNISWIIYHLGSMFGYGTSVFSIGIWCCCSRVLFWTTARGDVPQKKINRLFRKKLSIFLSTGECAFLSLHLFRLFVI